MIISFSKFINTSNRKKTACVHKLGNKTITFAKNIYINTTASLHLWLKQFATECDIIHLVLLVFLLFHKIGKSLNFDDLDDKDDDNIHH